MPVVCTKYRSIGPASTKPMSSGARGHPVPLIPHPSSPSRNSPIRSPGGSREGNEEGVALSVHLRPLLLGERLAQQHLVVGQDITIDLIAQLLQELGRPFDVGEEESDRPGGEARSDTGRHPLRSPGDDPVDPAPVVHEIEFAVLVFAERAHSQPGGKQLAHRPPPRRGLS